MSEPLLSLHPGTSVRAERGLLVARHRWGSTVLGPHTPALADALHTLLAGPVAPAGLARRLSAAVRADGSPPEPRLALLQHALELLGGSLLRHVVDGADPLVTAVPLAPEAAPASVGPSDTPVVLARAAHLRPTDGQLALESPQSRFRIRVEDHRVAALLALLARPATVAELRSAAPGLTDEPLDALLRLLRATGFLRPADAAGIPAGLAFHELLAYDGSRAGVRDRVYGPVFPLRGVEPPAPPVAPAPQGRTIALHRPDLERVAENDGAFTDVLESRASHRAYGEQPITVRQLGEFLYRAARVRTLLGADPEDGRAYAVTSRPYPSAGSAHELELYLAVHRCAGLEGGLYHYDPLGHALTALPGDAGALLREAAAATGGAGPPDVHVTLVSRIKRLSWKYAAHAYALTLKNSGVLLQTLYLVTTAMGLAGCALGGGDSDTPCAAFGLAPHTEIPVGAFLLGSAAAAIRPPSRARTT